MCRVGNILRGAVVVVLLASCGGSGHKATSSRAVSTTPTQTTASAPRSGLYAHVLTNGELSGFTTQTPTIEHDPHLYVVANQTPSAQVAAETARLKRLGFVAAVTENLTAAGQAGLSLVEQLRSRVAARAELAHNLEQERSTGQGYARFPVAGIPGAVGFSFTSAQGAGINIAWAEGPYYYLVGETVSAVTASSRSSLNAAARHLYQRTHG